MFAAVATKANLCKKQTSKKTFKYIQKVYLDSSSEQLQSNRLWRFSLVTRRCSTYNFSGVFDGVGCSSGCPRGNIEVFFWQILLVHSKQFLFSERSGSLSLLCFCARYNGFLSLCLKDVRASDFKRHTLRKLLPQPCRTEGGTETFVPQPTVQSPGVFKFACFDKDKVERGKITSLDLFNHEVPFPRACATKRQAEKKASNGLGGNTSSETKRRIKKPSALMKKKWTD